MNFTYSKHKWTCDQHVYKLSKRRESREAEMVQPNALAAKPNIEGRREGRGEVQMGEGMRRQRGDISVFVWKEQRRERRDAQSKSERGEES